MPTSVEFKHDLRIQLNDWREVIRYLDSNDLDRLRQKANTMIEIIEQSLQD